MNDAAEQYRAFLADALAQLATGYALVPDYPRAAPLFDEALALEPRSPSLLLEYAHTALALGDVTHAKTLATEFIQKYPDDRSMLPQAHQLLGRALLKLNEDHEARKELEIAVALDPTFPNGYDLAVVCLDLNDEKCAVQLFDEMERSFGDTAEIHMAFGRAYSESDSQPRAVTEFRHAIAENPRLPGAHYLLAAALLSTGGDQSQVKSAEEELKKELTISPHDSMTYAALGKLAVTRNNYSEAEAYLKKAVSLRSQDPDAYLYLGQVYFNTSRLTEAESAFRQCIHLTKDVSRNRYQVQQAHYLLGRILMKKGQQDAAHAEMVIAREQANKTLTQDKSKLEALTDTSNSRDIQSSGEESATSPSLVSKRANPLILRKVEALKEQLRVSVADAYNNLGVIDSTNSDYSHAITYFETAAIWNPSLHGLDYNWGRAAFAGSQYAEAIMPVSRYLKSQPDDTGARSVLAISQFMTGDYHGCIETLQSVIGRSGLAPQAEYAYAESMVRTGQVRPGIDRLEALEKSHPEIPDVYRALGEALDSQGMQSKALEELRAAIRISPSDADSHYDLGRVELESKDAVTAVSELEAAVRLSPSTLKFHRELADAYAAARRPEDARKELETCDVLKRSVQNNAAAHGTTIP
ncbi:MAG TPA: tetratricopeptide repeat protein [Acidobacteriaceae bacterium]